MGSYGKGDCQLLPPSAEFRVMSGMRGEALIRPRVPVFPCEPSHQRNELSPSSLRGVAGRGAPGF